MINTRFQFISAAEIAIILPLLKEVSAVKNEDLLLGRLQEMTEQNYKCLGIYDGNELIGICGLWFLTRHYCGRTVEPDHVFIRDDYKNHGIGNQLFHWLFAYCKENGIEATELNSYVENTRSHKFYYNLGYEIKGYHFLKILE